MPSNKKSKKPKVKDLKSKKVSSSKASQVKGGLTLQTDPSILTGLTEKVMINPTLKKSPFNPIF